MRFITEFEIDGNINTGMLSHLIPDKKAIREMGIGKDIGRAFGWDNYGSITLTGPVKEHFKLDIEAFPVDKWVEFRDMIIEESRKGRSNRTNNIIQMFKDLESFGKPSGDAITSLNKK